MAATLSAADGLNKQTVQSGQEWIGRNEIAGCVSAEDGEGYTIIYTHPGKVASVPPRHERVSFGTCPDRLPLVRVANEVPKRPASRAKDIREESPLRGIAVPFDFKKELATQDAVSNTPDDELADRNRIIHEAVWHFGRGDDDLDKLEQKLTTYREAKARTASGVWKLTMAYSAANSAGGDWTSQLEPAPYRWLEEKLDAWKAKYPQSPAPYIFGAVIASDRAVTIMNDRLARTKYPGGIQALKAELKHERTKLELHKALASSDPHYYAVLVTMMRNEGMAIEDILQVAFEGADRYPDYYETYFQASIAVGHLSKKPLDDLEALANTAVEKSKSTLGDEIYGRVYWYATQLVFGFDNISRFKWNWQKMKSSMDTIVSRYPVQWNIQSFAQFSCFMGDTAATKQYFDKTKGQAITTIWSQSEFMDACRQFAEATPEPVQPGTETRKANAP